VVLESSTRQGAPPKVTVFNVLWGEKSVPVNVMAVVPIVDTCGEMSVTVGVCSREYLKEQATPSEPPHAAAKPLT
jgi:hypothetical protein